MTTSIRSSSILITLALSSIFAQTATVEQRVGNAISVPLDDGNVMIERLSFIREKLSGGGKTPDLRFTLSNHTSSAWSKIEIQFEIDYVCSGVKRHRSELAKLTLGYNKQSIVKANYTNAIVAMFGEVDDCVDDTITATLVSADSLNSIHIDGVTGERIDMAERRRIENERKAEEDAKRSAEYVEATLKQYAAEEKAEAALKRQQAKEAAAYAKMKAAQDAKTAQELVRVRAACAAIYQRTSDMKVKDLTVKEEQQVRACQTLGLYPPR
jgi:hypothetical protein